MQTLMNILNSTGCQTMVIFISVVTTFLLYAMKKATNIRSAAIILLIQIRDIEKNIEYLISEGMTVTALNEQQLHYSIPIFEDNAWNKYKHIFATLLSDSDFAVIDQFYEVAAAIRVQQLAIKQKIYENIYSKTTNYYNQQYSRINACVLDIRENREDLCRIDLENALKLYNALPVGLYLHKEFGDGLSKGLHRYHRLTGTSTFEKLNKQSKIRMKF